MMRLGVLANTLADGIAVARGVAGIGQCATIILDDGALPETGTVILTANPTHATRLQHGGCTQFLLAMAPDEVAAAMPLADQLLTTLGVAFAPLCLAQPEAGITVYQGHIFRAAALLPGPEPNAVRLLAQHSDGTAALVPLGVVVQGANAIRRALAGMREQGRRYAVLDALTAFDVGAIAAACAGMPVLIGTPSLVPGLLSEGEMPTVAAQATKGSTAILAGATTRAALFQAALAREQLPHYTLAAGSDDMAALHWASGQPGAQSLLFCGPPALPHAAEPFAALATIALGLARAGVQRLVVTGPATIEAVLARLAVSRLATRAGSPWMRATCPDADLLMAFPDGSGGRTALLNLLEPET